jgi:hypothetical protein
MEEKQAMRNHTQQQNPKTGDTITQEDRKVLSLDQIKQTVLKLNSIRNTNKR